MRYLFISLLLLTGVFAYGQSLQPGFDPREYRDVLTIAFGKYDSLQRLQPSPVTERYRMAYRSAVVGLDNRWSLWVRNDNKVAMIQVRGTVASTSSWLANIYAAMIPAVGTVQLTDSLRFSYTLAQHPQAAVHTGWVISLAAIGPDVERQVKEQYEKGVRDFLLGGHSQGGAIVYLLRSYLHYRVQAGALPGDIRFKTYCSAAPKPGNLYYSYDYEYVNGTDWAFNVVNAADWVPETPFSIQQFRDMNELNPFADIKTALRKQKLPIRLYASKVYQTLNKSTRKAERKYQKYLGRVVGKQVRKKFPSLEHPAFLPSLNYMRTGTPVVLMPDAAYFTLFPNDPKQKAGIWNHHTFEAYYLLWQKQFRP